MENRVRFVEHELGVIQEVACLVAGEVDAYCVDEVFTEEIKSKLVYGPHFQQTLKMLYDMDSDEAERLMEEYEWLTDVIQFNMERMKSEGLEVVRS